MCLESTFVSNFFLLYNMEDLIMKILMFYTFQLYLVCSRLKRVFLTVFSILLMCLFLVSFPIRYSVGQEITPTPYDWKFIQFSSTMQLIVCFLIDEMRLLIFIFLLHAHFLTLSGLYLLQGHQMCQCSCRPRWGREAGRFRHGKTCNTSTHV